MGSRFLGVFWDRVGATLARREGNSIVPIGGGGGDSVTVNGAAVVDVDLDDATPAAPAGGLNVKWQKDASSPANVSAYIPMSSIDHSVLSNRVWTSSGHTGTANRVAVFDGGGAAAYATPTALVISGLPLTTKGDLLGYDSAPNRVPIGTDLSQTLVPDSSQALGLKWADRYTRFVITATGYTTVNLPTDCRHVRITCVGSGAGGGGGTTGDNTATRRGGGGGGASGWSRGVWARSILPDTVYAYVGAGGAAGTPGVAAGAGLISLVEVTNTGYAGTTTPQASSTLLYSGTRPAGGAQGVLGGGGGTASSAPATTGAIWARCADSWQGWPGRAGQAGDASTTPAALAPFGTTDANLAGGCGGAGKSAVPAAANGGGYAASGHLGAIAGGVAPGGAGTAGVFNGHGSSTVDELAYAWGGTGGASHTAGTGGAGGNGSLGCGGGGGGAGTVAGGNGGAGGDGFVIVECFG